MHKWLSPLLLLILVSIPAAAQTAAPVAVRDPNAVALAAKALQALAGGTAIKDITLQADATYIAGSDQDTGLATLVAVSNQQNPAPGGTGQSRVTLNLTNGQRQEIRDGANGAWADPDGTQHLMAFHNCWMDAGWFFPALPLQSLVADATVGVLYLGPAAWNGHAALHLRTFRSVQGLDRGLMARVQGLSATDFFLDPQSLLPLAVDFNLHPDSDMNLNIPVEIQFGDYRPVSGVHVPFRIRKYLQGTLMLDLVVSSAAINSGVPSSLFAIQASEGGEQ